MLHKWATAYLFVPQIVTLAGYTVLFGYLVFYVSEECFVYIFMILFLVVLVFQNVSNHPAENTFLKFGLLVIFHLSFFVFITTIGLNIILGIIVDTFSELRDLKVTSVLCVTNVMSITQFMYQCSIYPVACK